MYIIYIMLHVYIYIYIYAIHESPPSTTANCIIGYIIYMWFQKKREFPKSHGCRVALSLTGEDRRRSMEIHGSRVEMC